MVYTTDLKSVASNGLRVQVPPLVPSFVALAQWIEQWSSTPQVGSSNLSCDARLCRWNQLDGYWIANPWKQVRFLSPTPDISCLALLFDV